jgi:hypothetical protein
MFGCGLAIQAGALLGDRASCGPQAIRSASVTQTVCQPALSYQQDDEDGMPKSSRRDDLRWNAT